MSNVPIDGLDNLSAQGLTAFLTALQGLPDDRENPEPLCARLSKVLDLLQALAAREDLVEADRALFRQWRALPDASLLVHVIDRFRELT